MTQAPISRKVAGRPAGAASLGCARLASPSPAALVCVSVFLSRLPLLVAPVSMSLVGAAPQNIPRTWPLPRGSPRSLPALRTLTWMTRECAAPAKMLLFARGAWGRGLEMGAGVPGLGGRWAAVQSTHLDTGEELPHPPGADLPSRLGSAWSREGFI